VRVVAIVTLSISVYTLARENANTNGTVPSTRRGDTLPLTRAPCIPSPLCRALEIAYAQWKDLKGQVRGQSCGTPLVFPPPLALNNSVLASLLFALLSQLRSTEDEITKATAALKAAKARLASSRQAYDDGVVARLGPFADGTESPVETTSPPPPLAPAAIADAAPAVDAAAAVPAVDGEAAPADAAPAADDAAPAPATAPAPAPAPIPAPTGPVFLSVGGKLFACPRALLCRDRTSALAALCRPGAPESPLGTTPEAPLFVDRDPTSFEHILAFLDDGPAALPQAPSDLRLLYTESAHYVLLTLRDAIEEKLLALAAADDDESAAAGSQAAAASSSFDQGSSSSWALTSAANAAPTAQSQSLLAAAAALTRARTLNDTMAASGAPRGLSSSSSFSTSSSSLYSGTGGGMSATAAQLRRTLAEIDLAIPAARGAAQQAQQNGGAKKDAPAPAPPAIVVPDVLSTGEYISGTWKRYYATTTTPSTTGGGSGSGSGGEAAVGFPTEPPMSPLRASYESLQRAAEATALPDPFGFSRKSKVQASVAAAATSTPGRGAAQSSSSSSSLPSSAAASPARPPATRTYAATTTLALPSPSRSFSYAAAAPAPAPAPAPAALEENKEEGKEGDAASGGGGGGEWDGGKDQVDWFASLSAMRRAALESAARLSTGLRMPEGRGGAMDAGVQTPMAGGGIGEPAAVTTTA
jgi:hypothetical protein